MKEIALAETGNTYNDSAVKFLQDTGTRMFAELSPDPIEWREWKGTKLPCLRFVVRLVRGSRHFEATFTSSINDSWLALVGREFKSRVTLSDESKINFAVKTIGQNKRIKLPTPYDFLACLQKYSCEDHADFCGEFGYDSDSIKGRETWIAVRDEYRMLACLYNDSEMEQLQEIN